MGSGEAISPRRKFKLCAEHGTKNALGFPDRILVWTPWCRPAMFATLSYTWPQLLLSFISRATNSASRCVQT